MKLIQLFTFLVMSFSGIVYAASGHDLKPVHGGAVAAVKDITVEFVATADSLLLYLSDHGKPVDISRSTAKATILQGAEKQEVELKTAGLRFEATGSFKIANAKVVVTVSQPGKAPVNVRFTLK